MAGLAAAVQEDRGWIVGVAGDVGRKAVAVASGELDHAAARSRICTPQAEPSPITCASPTRAPSI
jgi:hypothetical protein